MIHKEFDLIKDILDWVKYKNESIHVNITKTSLKECKYWFYDVERGVIRNRDNTFFQISGIRKHCNNETIYEQPIILQNEIGYLGIICKEIDGKLYFLMQAKIEPGNINKVQISPTIQATKSNFTGVHGGATPAYLEYFKSAEKYEIVADQLQSEQSSRFYKKRNRNIIIKIDEEIEVLSSHKWMTLSQVKALLKINNIVNMDTRTVLSCLPTRFNDTNVEENQVDLTSIYHRINNFKMYDDSKVSLVPLHSLNNWAINEYEINSKTQSPFKVVFCDIEIEGREVRSWSQPLFEATGKALFGLFTCVEENTKKFLVKLTPEIGCFDKIEIGPTLQIEDFENAYGQDEVSNIFLDKLKRYEDVLHDVILSEEGGRFYHEENRNVIIEIDKNYLTNLSHHYFWVDYKSLSRLVMINNILNIQLRNLMSLLEVQD